MRALRCLPLALTLLGCGDDTTLECGEGTRRDGARCVVADMELVRQLGDGEPTGVDSAPQDATPGPPDALEHEPDADLPEPDARATTLDMAPPEPDAADECALGQAAVGVWSGPWTGDIVGDSPIVGGEFEYATSGDLSFSATCEDRKLLIEGTLAGVAENLYPFHADLRGTFDGDTSMIVLVMSEGVVEIDYEGFHIDVQFAGQLEGVIDGDRIPLGTWAGESTFPRGAQGEGTWSAIRR